MNEILERCAGMDVHKKFVTVCLMIGRGKETKKQIKTFQTTTPELYKLAKWLKSYNVKKIAMESTGIYWKPLYNVFEESFDVILANPQHMKNIPGKKTDVKDAEWICTLLKYDLLRKSFIPPKETRDFRNLMRLRKKYTQLKTSANNRIVKFLESANIKLKSVTSRINGASAWNVVKAIAGGETDPQRLAALITTRIKATKELVIDALTGIVSENDIMMIQFAVQEVEFYEKQLKIIDCQIKERETKFEMPLATIRSFPGIGEITGAAILAEIGTDMTQFPTEDHLTSWAGLVPGKNESAGKNKSARIAKGNTYLKISLLQSAWCAIREKDGHWKTLYYRLRPRLGAKKAIIAIARRILKAIYFALSKEIDYKDLCLKENPNRIIRSIEYYKKKIEELSQKIEPANS